MFKKTTFFALFTVLTLWTLLLFTLFKIKPSDYSNFEKLQRKETIFQPICQLRQGVQKDIWFSENGEKRHFSIFSQRSELTLHLLSKEPEVMERLFHIECLLQDKLFLDANGNPWQELRYFTAEEGVYLFPSYRFLCPKMEVSFYQAPSHLLPATLTNNKSFLTGVASDVSFDLSEKTPSFFAHHLTAKVPLP